MITLGNFTSDDFQRLIAWIDSERLLVQFSAGLYEYPLTEAQLARYTETKLSKTFTVKLNATNTIIGHCELGGIDLKNHRATLCRLLIGEKTLRGKGFGQQAAIEALRYGFEELGCLRIDVDVFTFNKGAIALYKKIGFQEEGVMRDYCRVMGESWSCLKMSILYNEFRELHS
jgi:RimJ/RimL family protein N-acetyltransferase